MKVRDDGIGGADPSGHGLVGMRDRVTALGGKLDVDSPPGGGTVLTATLPISRERVETGLRLAMITQTVWRPLTPTACTLLGDHLSRGD